MGEPAPFPALGAESPPQHTRCWAASWLHFAWRFQACSNSEYNPRGPGSTNPASQEQPPRPGHASPRSPEAGIAPRGREQTKPAPDREGAGEADLDLSTRFCEKVAPPAPSIHWMLSELAGPVQALGSLTAPPSLLKLETLGRSGEDCGVPCYLAHGVSLVEVAVPVQIGPRASERSGSD